MKENKKIKELKDVAAATRDAVVGAAGGVRTFTKKTVEFVTEVEKRWDASKPRRQKARSELTKATQQAVAFGKDVRQGLKEGFAKMQTGKKA